MALPRSLRITLVLTSATALLAAPVFQGSAEAGPKLKTWATGTVKAVADGDTIWVDYDGDHSKKKYKIRLAAVQATETKHRDVSGSKNWCHGQAAGSVLRKLVQGKKVRLRAEKKGSKSQGRPLRYVDVKSGGRWVDVQELMLNRGQVMNFNFNNEDANNAKYSGLAQQAATTGRGLWDTDFCGSGPQQALPIRTWVHWDAQGVDDQNLNDEYVVFENRSATETLSLRNWMARDTSLLVYRFPSNATIAPNSYVKLHVGRGTNTAQDFYWGQRSQLFQNTDVRGQSDVVVLMDPQGDFRSWGAYPCRVNCADPNAGALGTGTVVYNPDGDENLNPNTETFTIVNRSTEDRRLSGYYVTMDDWFAYTFSPNRTIAPGASITFHVGKGDATDTDIYLGMTGSHLPNSGGTIKLYSWAGPRLACADWGNKHC